MKDDHKQLDSLMTRRGIKPFKLSKVIGVSIAVIQNYIAGIPIKAVPEAKLETWIRGQI